MTNVNTHFSFFKTYFKILNANILTVWNKALKTMALVKHVIFKTDIFRKMYSPNGCLFLQVFFLINIHNKILENQSWYK